MVSPRDVAVHYDGQRRSAGWQVNPNLKLYIKFHPRSPVAPINPKHRKWYRMDIGIFAHPESNGPL
eukprot:2651888-Amphidinium_carterae.1